MKFSERLRHICLAVVNAYCDGLFQSMPVNFAEGEHS